MLTIGLTGDVGAGKSTLCRVWREMGATIFDADTIARNMWKLPDVQIKTEKRWGPGFFEGDWDAVLAKIAEKIFSDDLEYIFVSELIHDRTKRELKNCVEQSSGWVVVEIPLLYECGIPDWIDYVIYAAASIEKRIESNAVRNWDSDELLRREGRLIPREEKLCLADLVIENIGTIEEWETKAQELGKIFIEKTKKREEDSHLIS